jgi:NADH:ubiquinone oxidoreductase subunit E
VTRQEKLTDPRLVVIRRACLGTCGRSPAVRVGNRLMELTGAEACDIVDEVLAGDPAAGGRR